MPTSFQEKVYSKLREVPKGKVTTYGDLAKALKLRPLASRAIGTAMNKNPYAPRVPCHRVIKSGGEIGGFASGTSKKISMLKSEGVEVKNNKIDLVRFRHNF